ncbi:MAG: HD domain-containing phosphohydrolase, partial [Rubrivivax sp.]
IHLEGGWLSHPFPLSSFKLATAQQIATVRNLGLKEVRWLPEKSDAAESAPVPAPPAPGAPTAPGSAQVVVLAVPAAASAAGAAGPDPTAAERELARHAARQFAEAAGAWREAHAAVAANPGGAGAQALKLAQAMLQKMMVDGDMRIRLIPDAGDRNAAHALNVTVVSMLIARNLGLEPEVMVDLAVGALMHDIGKQDVPDRFRHAESGFSAAELNAYRDHVAKGLLQGRRMGLSAGALSVLAQHHEHVDGSGFPQRHGVDKLTMASRIVAIVNRYDNLCNPGARGQALTPHEAVATLFAQGRTRYDATVLNAFIRMMGVYPAGSLVQLTDERYGMVVAVNASRPLRPRVLVSDGNGESPRARILDLESVSDLGIRRSLPAAKLPMAVLQALDPRPRVAYFFEPLQQARAAVALAA